MIAQVVLDASCPASIGEGWGMALQFAADGGMPLPVGVWANKQDEPGAVAADAMHSLMGDIDATAVHVMEGSALTGDGISGLLEWLAAAPTPAAAAAAAAGSVPHATSATNAEGL